MTFARESPAWLSGLLRLSLWTSCADVTKVEHPLINAIKVPSHLRHCPERPAVPAPDLPVGRYSDLLASSVIVAQAEWIETCEARIRALDELLREFESPRLLNRGAKCRWRSAQQE